MSETYSDPSRLFTIALPEGFRRDEDARSLVFRHSDIDGAITVTCLRHRVGDKQPELFDALPSRESIQNVQSFERDGIRIRYGEYEGELQNQTEAWRWWTLQRGPVGIVVSFNGSPEAAESRRDAVDELVRGIQIADKPPVSMEDFTSVATEVYAETLKAPKPEIIKPLELRTSPQASLRLDNAYVTYLHEWEADPDADIRKLLATWFEHLWGEQRESVGTFEDVRGLIYPVVRAWGFGRDTKVKVLRRPLLDGELELFAALDTGRTLRFISSEDLAAWEGVSEDDVFFYARENLLALSSELEMQALAGQDGTPRAVIIATGDSHDAARIVLPQFYEKLATVLGPNLLAGIPNRDFLIVLSADDAELVGQVAAQVKVDAESRPYPISGKLYKLSASGLSLSTS
jgi:uncharacterized protein YtpQ (UPF0354 family)